MHTNHFRHAWFWLALAVFAAAPQVSAQQVVKPADLSGVWIAPGGRLNPVQADRRANPQSQWSTEMLPFTAEGRAAFEANKPGRGPRAAKPVEVNDPQEGANPNGLYRTMMYARPFEIVQTPGKVIQLFGWGLSWRNIYADGRPVPDAVPAGPFWYGHSVGKWEGDTLVVTTLALDERAWLDEWGTPYSAEARIEERWRRIAPDKLQLQITVNDPVYYTKSWLSIPVTFALQRGVDPIEIIFAPMDMATFNETLRKPASPPAEPQTHQ